MITVTNIRPYGKKSVGYDFEVNVSPYLVGLAFFVNSLGYVNHTVENDYESLKFSSLACDEIYQDLVFEAPDGMKLLPREEAMKDVESKQ